MTRKQRLVAFAFYHLGSLAGRIIRARAVWKVMITSGVRAVRYRMDTAHLAELRSRVTRDPATHEAYVRAAMAYTQRWGHLLTRTYEDQRR